MRRRRRRSHRFMRGAPRFRDASSRHTALLVLLSLHPFSSYLDALATREASAWRRIEHQISDSWRGRPSLSQNAPKRREDLSLARSPSLSRAKVGTHTTASRAAGGGRGNARWERRRRLGGGGAPSCRSSSPSPSSPSSPPSPQPSHPRPALDPARRSGSPPSCRASRPRPRGSTSAPLRRRVGGPGPAPGATWAASAGREEEEEEDGGRRPRAQRQQQQLLTQRTPRPRQPQQTATTATAR